MNTLSTGALLLLLGSWNTQPLGKSGLGVPHKVKQSNHMTDDPTSRVIPQKWKTGTQIFSTNVNSSINHNRQNVKTHRCLTSEWINNMYIYTCIHTHTHTHPHPME